MFRLYFLSFGEQHQKMFFQVSVYNHMYCSGEWAHSERWGL